MRFGPLFNESLKKAHYSQRAFAIKVGYKQQNINQIVRGDRLPPLDHLEEWADLLKPTDREAFLEAGWLEHCPPQVCELVERLRRNQR